MQRKITRSNFRPFDLTSGLVWLCGTPGAGPNRRSANLCFLGPCINTVPLPLGASKASWSKVIILPPAFIIRARAFLVT